MRCGCFMSCLNCCASGGAFFLALAILDIGPDERLMTDRFPPPNSTDAMSATGREEPVASAGSSRSAPCATHLR